jgi:hypothetical protein
MPGGPAAGAIPIAERTLPRTRPGRLASAASELAQRLATAPPEVRGYELARIQGDRTLRYVQQPIASLLGGLAPPTGPTAARALEPPPPVRLTAAQARDLRSAAVLATEALRLEDMLSEPLSSALADRMLYQLELAVLGRDLDPGRGLAELRSLGQRALAALAPTLVSLGPGTGVMAPSTP